LQEKIPIYTARYVLVEYGTGAVMGVPAHDSRDFKFAKQQALPIKRVIEPAVKTPDAEKAFEGDGTLINSGHYNGMLSEKARVALSDEAQKMQFGKKKHIFKLRDWLISRQRYWGVPIPIVYCEGSCPDEKKIVAVPESMLPVKLPHESLSDTLKKSIFSASYGKGKGGNPLNSEQLGWTHTTCPNCGGKARRETDTMDTFVDSSWYFMRYPDSKNEAALCSKEQLHKWLPVDLYVGGVEHAILHLLYSRFVSHFFFKTLKLLPKPEPFTNVTQMINIALLLIA